jgi:hypothetical protein
MAYKFFRKKTQYGLKIQPGHLGMMRTDEKCGNRLLFGLITVEFNVDKQIVVWTSE